MTHRTVQETTVTAATTAAGTETLEPAPQRPTTYPSTHYGGKLPAPGGVVATEMNNIIP